MDIWQAIIAQLPALRRYALSLTGQLDQADDLVQSTVERAYQKFTLFHRGRRLRPWLFSILHNLYVDSLRRSQQTVAGEADDTMDPMPAHSALQRDLYQALQQLPLEQRSVVLLVDLAGFRYREVARILAIPEGTVMSRLARARAQLQQSLASYQTSNVRKLSL